MKVRLQHAALSFLVLARTGIAQDDIADLAGLPPCAQSCLPKAMPTSCGAIDFACACSGLPFLSIYSCCVAGACSDENDQEDGLKFQSRLCSAVGVSIAPRTSASCDGTYTVPSSTSAPASITSNIRTTPTTNPPNTASSTRITDPTSTGASATTTPTPQQPSLSTGAKAGIGVGVGVGSIIIIALLLLLYRARRQKSSIVPASPPTAQPPVQENQWKPPPVWTAEADGRQVQMQPQELDGSSSYKRPNIAELGS